MMRGLKIFAVSIVGCAGIQMDTSEGPVYKKAKHSVDVGLPFYIGAMYISEQKPDTKKLIRVNQDGVRTPCTFKRQFGNGLVSVRIGNEELVLSENELFMTPELSENMGKGVKIQPHPESFIYQCASTLSLPPIDLYVPALAMGIPGDRAYTIIENARRGRPVPDLVVSLPVDFEVVGDVADGECSICFDALQNGEEVGRFKCGHQLHAACARELVLRSRIDSCPECMFINK